MAGINFFYSLIFNIVNQFRNIFLIPVRNQRMRYCLSIISTFQNIEKCILYVQSDEDYLAFEILISSKSKYIKKFIWIIMQFYKWKEVFQ